MNKGKINKQMRKGIDKVISWDVGVGIIIRAVMVDNGRGSKIKTADETKHNILCRISSQGGGVWGRTAWDGGLKTELSPYLLARVETDVKEGDILQWRGKEYEVGAVSFPQVDGGAVCLQAQITEIKETA
jgi:hypothetical protein